LSQGVKLETDLSLLITAIRDRATTQSTVTHWHRIFIVINGRRIIMMTSIAHPWGGYINTCRYFLHRKIESGVVNNVDVSYNASFGIAYVLILSVLESEDRILDSRFRHSSLLTGPKA